MFSTLKLTAAVVLAATLVSAQNKPDFDVKNLPDKWEQGQVGSNSCKQWGESSSKSMCQNVFVNSATDFCLFAPFENDSTIGDKEERTISYCTQKGYGTRVFPSGTIKGAYFIKAPDFVQITGKGDFTSIGIRVSDEGGELDPHGANLLGNPPGGLVFSRSFKGQEGKWVQSKEWSSFMSATEFSLRAAIGPQAAKFAPHIYDVLGSQWNHPGIYDEGYFENCDSDNGPFPGVFNGKTFHQGDPHTPAGHAPARVYNCKRQNGIPQNGVVPSKPYRKRSLQPTLSPARP